jgi:hypothetical protein
MFKNRELPEGLLWGSLQFQYPTELCEACKQPAIDHDAGGYCPTEFAYGVEIPLTRTATIAHEKSCKDTNPKDAIGSKKAPMSTLPAGVLAEMGVAMLEGKAKYGAFNYRIAGVRSSVYYDALMRHIMAWWEGEDIDPDSGLPHVVKALVTLAVLRDAQRNGMVTDDRPPISPIGYANLNAKTAAIIEMHKDKSPRHYTREDKIVPIAKERT